MLENLPLPREDYSPVADCSHCDKFSSGDQSHKTSADQSLYQMMLDSHILKKETQTAYKNHNQENQRRKAHIIMQSINEPLTFLKHI